MSSPTCLVVGASHAAAQLCVSLRQHGWTGAITLIGEEAYLPYNRPPLSKTFLAGEKNIDELLIRHASGYEKAGVRFLPGQRVVAIDRHSKTVTLANGDALAYDKLALTVGARPRLLHLPGADLDGVCYLRKIDDVERIRPYAKAGNKAVIVGGGYIGLEAAAMFRNLGMGVTILEKSSHILSRTSPPRVSEFYTRIHREAGVEIMTGIELDRFEGGKGHVETVICRDGRAFAADVVIGAIGIMPNTELAEEAGLKVNDGIVIDSHCRSSDPDIVAAGDCTRFFSHNYHTDLRLESVPNAVDQARVAAATLCGKAAEYHELPWFWSDQYDLKLQIAGLSQGFDDMVVRGDIDAGRKFAAFFFQGRRLLAVDAVNSPQEFMFGRRAIAENRLLDRQRLRDTETAMRDILKDAPVLELL